MLKKLSTNSKHSRKNSLFSSNIFTNFSLNCSLSSFPYCPDFSLIVFQVVGAEVVYNHANHAIEHIQRRECAKNEVPIRPVLQMHNVEIRIMFSFNVA